VNETLAKKFTYEIAIDITVL